MRISTQASYILAAAVLASGMCVYAGPAAGKVAATRPAHTTQADSAEVQTLRAAYTTLEQADHDYQGHRIHAMHALEKACDLLGSDIRGDGKGKEPQPTSDAQLSAALTQIQQVRDGLAAGTQPKVVAHLDVAIKQIGIALSIK